MQSCLTASLMQLPQIHLQYWLSHPFSLLTVRFFLLITVQGLVAGWHVCVACPPPPSCVLPKVNFCWYHPPAQAPWNGSMLPPGKSPNCDLSWPNPTFQPCLLLKRKRIFSPVPQQECCYVPTGLACPTHLLNTFLRPEISLSLSSWNLLNSSPSFKDLLKGYFLWKKPTLVCDLSLRTLTTLILSWEMYAIVPSITLLWAIAFSFLPS